MLADSIEDSKWGASCEKGVTRKSMTVGTGLGSFSLCMHTQCMPRTPVIHSATAYVSQITVRGPMIHADDLVRPTSACQRITNPLDGDSNVEDGVMHGKNHRDGGKRLHCRRGGFRNG